MKRASKKHRLGRWATFVILIAVLMVGGFVFVSLLNGKQLKVSLHPWPGYESFMLADSFGWLSSEIGLVSVQNASQTLKLLEQGEVHAAALTLDEAIYARSQGMPLDIIAILDESVGADVLLSWKSNSALSDLQGTTIAYEGNTVSSLVLSQLLQLSGLNRADVELVKIPPNDQITYWSTETFDYAISFEPYASYLENLGAKRVIDSRAFPNVIYDVLVVRNDARFFRETAIKDLLWAHFKALHYIRVNSEDALRRIAAWRSLSYEENRKAFSGLYLPDLDYNKRMLNVDSEFYDAVKMVNITMNGGTPLLSENQLKAMLQPAFLFRID